MAAGSAVVSTGGSGVSGFFSNIVETVGRVVDKVGEVAEEAIPVWAEYQIAKERAEFEADLAQIRAENQLAIERLQAQRRTTHTGGIVPTATTPTGSFTADFAPWEMVAMIGIGILGGIVAAKVL